MKRESRGYEPRTPNIKPVERVTLSEKNTTARFIAVIALIAVAVLAFTVGISEALKPDSGWREVTAKSSAETVCAGEFTFNYNVGNTAEYKLLSEEYTKATDEAYKVFSTEKFEGVNNVKYLNDNINKAVEVDETLYKALETLEKYDSRYIFLAPVYEQYRGLFSSVSDVEAKEFDPYTNAEQREYFDEVLSFANDKEHIGIELLGGNMVKLNVSDEYISFAEENGIEEYIDFFWLKNAFIIDFTAERLTEKGFKEGTINSFDGFSRTMDDSKNEYSFNIYDRAENTVYQAAVMSYDTKLSSVRFKNYPMGAMDVVNYYEFESGEIRTPYIDLNDGLCKSAKNDLAAFSKNSSCAECALEALPLYAAESFDESMAKKITEGGVELIVCEENKIYCTSDEVEFRELYSDEDVEYRLER